MRFQITLRRFLVLCFLLGVAFATAIIYWNPNHLEFSRLGIHYHDVPPIADAAYQQLNADASKIGLEIVARPGWASGYNWDSAQTTWFRLASEGKNVVAFAVLFNENHFEAHVTSSKDCKPWDNNDSEEEIGQQLVEILRKWWVEHEQQAIAK